MLVAEVELLLEALDLELGLSQLLLQHVDALSGWRLLVLDSIWLDRDRSAQPRRMTLVDEELHWTLAKVSDLGGLCIALKRT